MSIINNEDTNIIDLLFINKKDGDNLSSFFYISNPDGTIRWIYPISLKRPTFLAFYSTSSMRAKLIALSIKTFFLFKLNKLLKAKPLEINIDKKSIIGNILENYPTYNYSIFTGTVGVNRKAILELNKNNETEYFVKISLTESSKELIHNEADILEYINSFTFENIEIPKIIEKNDDYIIIDNIKQNSSYQTNSIDDIHIKALDDLYSRTLTEKKLEDIDSVKESSLILNKLETSEINTKLPHEKIKDILTNIANIKSTLTNDIKINLGLAHCDFTPWNMYVTNNKLSVFDWELSNKDTVLLYDLFHYIFQAEILINKQGYSSIINTINTVFQNEHLKEIIKKYNIDINLNYILYLEYTVLYYLDKYNSQEELHSQVFWLIDIWNKALKDIVKKEGKVIHE
ncbi:hypothetical protein LPB137_10400 [Poseidonibacter parvus]|uniref:Aminoglycoside phosphotransferase domain-containing protein n=1 Tax=Poseidonibacter parvus TaxID=1850254 RepID=A0A1P8KNV2_9BACT|nr:hypothetical protein [Poseidonibacter parvus]APW66225.1 hypothetical protein LPB137_10400 [Poseidonibacter parvus]